MRKLYVVPLVALLIICACDAKELTDKTSPKAISETVTKTDWKSIQQQRQHELVFNCVN